MSMSSSSVKKYNCFDETGTNLCGKSCDHNKDFLRRQLEAGGSKLNQRSARYALYVNKCTMGAGRNKKYFPNPITVDKRNRQIKIDRSPVERTLQSAKVGTGRAASSLRKKSSGLRRRVSGMGGKASASLRKKSSKLKRVASSPLRKSARKASSLF